MDKFGILHGEDAKRFREMLDAPGCDGDCLSCDKSVYTTCEKRINPKVKAGRGTASRIIPGRFR
jgi:hypothetical protein